MFRAIIKDRLDLDGPQIADIPVLSGSITEDKTQKATSSFVVSDFPEGAKEGDVIGIYDGTGKFYYWGVINSKGEVMDDEYHKIRTRTIECNQFESLYDDDQLIVAQTTANQKKIFNDKSPSDIVDFFLTSKEWGYTTIKNTANANYSPQFSGFIDKDLKAMFKGIRHEIIDDGLSDNNTVLSDSTTINTDRIKFPIEKETVNLEDFLYNVFDKYRRIIRPYFNNPILPSEYQQVLYIESDGTDQYIDTGVSPADYVNTMRIELDAQFTQIPSSANSYLLSSGYYNSTADSRRNILVGIDNSTSKFSMLSGAQQSSWVKLYAADTDRHLFIIDQIKSSYILNNNSNFTTTVSNKLVKPIILFAYYSAAQSGAPITSYHPGRIYGLRIYNSGTCIRNMVPCYRKSDNEVGMYDTVNGVFYANAAESGTGVLTKSDKSYDRTLNVAMLRPNGVVTYNLQHTWDYSEKVLFDSWESVKNVSITDEEVETNTVMAYSADGATLRGAFTVLKDGTIQQMTTDTAVENRYGAGKTTYVFDETNTIKDIAQNNLPASQFNHKITFDILFNGEYKFEDFNLGQRIKFYSKTRPGKVYESCLTAWSYEINQNSDKIYNAKFTLGNLRRNLTSKINLNVKKKK